MEYIEYIVNTRHRHNRHKHRSSSNDDDNGYTNSSKWISLGWWNWYTNEPIPKGNLTETFFTTI